MALLGRTDFVFRKERVVVFVDGCFWHKCPQCNVAPRSNTEYWDGKIAGNVSRDQAISAYLEGKGWIVVRFWEHDLRSAPEELLDGFALILASRSATRAPSGKNPRVWEPSHGSDPATTPGSPCLLMPCTDAGSLPLNTAPYLLVVQHGL